VFAIKRTKAFQTQIIVEALHDRYHLRATNSGEPKAVFTLKRRGANQNGSQKGKKKSATGWVGRGRSARNAGD
jgi:hypothetical protein